MLWVAATYAVIALCFTIRGEEEISSNREHVSSDHDDADKSKRIDPPTASTTSTPTTSHAAEETPGGKGPTLEFGLIVPGPQCPNITTSESVQEALLVPNRCCKTSFHPNISVPWVDGWKGKFYLLPLEGYGCQKIDSFNEKPTKWNAPDSNHILTLCEYVHDEPKGIDAPDVPEATAGRKEPTLEFGLIVDGRQCPIITTSEGDVLKETWFRLFDLLVCQYENHEITWPDGKYCMYRAAQGSCPHGLEKVSVEEESLVRNRCCKRSSHPTFSVPWVDGWKEDFFLLPFENYSCQKIDSFTERSIKWNSHNASVSNHSLTLCKYVHDSGVEVILASTLAPLSVLIMGGSVFVIYRKRRLKRKKRQTHLQMMLNGPNKDVKRKGKRDLEIGSLLKMILDPESQMTIYGLLVQPDHIEIMERVGKGAFGTVHQGRYRPDNNPLNVQEVAIKTLKENCVYPEISAFMEEAIVMADFRHVNVLSIVGVCIDPKTDIPSLVLPFMRHGDLQKYLRGFRYDDEKKDQTPELPQLLSFCQHIARGMAYLANMKFVHRDLAARNCMLNGDLVVKVADFGLTRDIYSSSYYRQDKNKLLPIKWMALESLQDRVFSTYTDVWSYSVAVWEIFTLGKVPYPNLENIEVLPQLEKGQRLPKPDTCPDSVYDIMARCWDENPKERPSFSDICEILDTTLAGLLDYLDLDRGKTEALDLSTGVVSSPRESIQPVPPPSRSTYADYRMTQGPETSQIPPEVERF